jgi:hypothetical protein
MSVRPQRRLPDTPPAIHHWRWIESDRRRTHRGGRGRSRLGDYFAEVLLPDQRTIAAKAPRP